MNFVSQRTTSSLRLEKRKKLVAPFPLCLPFFKSAKKKKLKNGKKETKKLPYDHADRLREGRGGEGVGGEVERWHKYDRLIVKTTIDNTHGGSRRCHVFQALRVDIASLLYTNFALIEDRQWYPSCAGTWHVYLSHSWLMSQTQGGPRKWEKEAARRKREKTREKERECVTAKKERVIERW